MRLEPRSFCLTIGAARPHRLPVARRTRQLFAGKQHVSWPERGAAAERLTLKLTLEVKRLCCLSTYVHEVSHFCQTHSLY